MRHTIQVQLVRLVGDEYTQPPGSLGVVEASNDDRTRHFVAWASPEHGPYGSGPIAEEDLELVGFLSVKLPEETERRLAIADLKDPRRIAFEALRKAVDDLEVP